MWRQQSMSVSDTVRHSSDSVIFETYPELGYNYRLTDVQAAMGREQLKRLPELIDRRRKLASEYVSCCKIFPVCMCHSNRNGHAATGRVIVSGCRQARPKRRLCSSCGMPGSLRGGELCARILSQLTKKRPGVQRDH